MNIHFLTEIVYGYILTLEEYLKLREDISSYARYIDGYIYQEANNFYLGICLREFGPGEYVNLTNIIEPPEEESREILQKLLEMMRECGLNHEDPRWNTPQIYACARVIY